MEDSRVVGVRWADGTTMSADAVVSAVPPSALSRLLNPTILAGDPVLSGLKRFGSSPIISINLWLDRPVTQDLFVGFVGTRIQWLFNKPAILARAGLKTHYMTLILSAAEVYLDQTNEDLVRMALEDLTVCFPRARSIRLIRSQVVREREATVSLTVGMERYRPGPATSLANFTLAGDWTATGLPATIESAVVSGRRSAQQVLKGLVSGPRGGKIAHNPHGA